VQIGCTISLEPRNPRVSFRELLAAWHRVGFRPAACSKVLQAAIDRDASLSEFLNPAEIGHGAVVATDKLLYGCWSESRPWSCRIYGVANAVSLSLDHEEVETMSQIIRAAADATDIGDLGDRLGEMVTGDSMSEIIQLLTSPAQVADKWPAVSAPGIYRREHASLVIRSSNTTVLVDPTNLAPGWTTFSGRYPGESGLGHVDCVLVTHSHNDHWSLASILTVADERTAVVVPPVPRVSILCHESMLDAVSSVGLSVEAPGWESTIEVGDVQIDVLPFYGEQPTRAERGLPRDLRNWGSCYRINAPDFSAVLLADAGSDSEGSMIDALRRSYQKRGPVDALLSVPSEFPEGINMGLPHYAFTLPFSDLERIRRERPVPSITLGPSGIVEACRVAGARYYLPYADGFAGIGRPSRSGESRTSASAAAEAELEARLAPTRYISWLPGDVAEFRDRSIVVRRTGL
jgi:L-ascorbate metabolism protein UlaG (beta-lactamase superfamily)